MESFFVPVYLKLGKLVEEKLLVAIIMVTPQKIQIKYSNKRIQLSGQVISLEYANLAKEVLDQVQFKANEVNTILNKTGEFEFNNSHVFNAEYFEYLKKYSQNTLLFGNVETFNFQSSSVSFDKLYESLMNEKIEMPKMVKPSFHTKIKASLKASGIDTKADIDYKITSDKLIGLYNDMTVSLISKNGSIIAADAIDFNNGMFALSNSLNAFEVLINSLNQFSQKNKLKKGSYHILNSVPPAGSDQEKMLNSIFKYKKDLYKVVPEDSIQLITDKIKKGNYSKFSLAFTN